MSSGTPIFKSEPVMILIQIVIRELCVHPEMIQLEYHLCLGPVLGFKGSLCAT